MVDTGSSDRISNPNFSLCRELVKIDHHPNVEPYAPTLWVEEDCSSCCEMIAALAETFPETLKLDAQAAACLYLGMVTDSGRFRFPGVNGDTLRRAAFLMDAGVDTERLYARLYLREFDSFRFEAWVYDRLQRTENGVAGCGLTGKRRNNSAFPLRAPAPPSAIWIPSGAASASWPSSMRRTVPFGYGCAPGSCR